MPDLGIPWHTDGFDAFGALYIDDIEQERSMEKPMVPLKFVSGELADVLAFKSTQNPNNSVINKPVPDKPALDKPIGFVFRGVAAGDLAVASLAYRRATGKD